MISIHRRFFCKVSEFKVLTKFSETPEEVKKIQQRKAEREKKKKEKSEGTKEEKKIGKK